MGIKLDIGCGPNKKPGHLGVDKFKFNNVDFVCDLGKEKLPCADSTVEEIHASHFLEHLNAEERVHLMNEAYRVLEPKGRVTIICPYWGSGRAYGDPTHQWPPISDFWFYYLDEKWRMENAPHTDKRHWEKGYSCNFEATWGYTLHGEIISRNMEFQQFATMFYKEAVQDICATLIKR